MSCCPTPDIEDVVCIDDELSVPLLEREVESEIGLLGLIGFWGAMVLSASKRCCCCCCWKEERVVNVPLDCLENEFGC